MVRFDTHFISQNTSPDGCGQMLVYRGDTCVGRVRTDRFSAPVLGERQYSFGVIADVHLSGSAASLARLERALSDLRHTEQVDFTVIAGDITEGGTAAQFASFRAAADDTAEAMTSPVYAVTGECDCLGGAVAATDGDTRLWTGCELYFSFAHGEDVFVLLGMAPNGDGTPHIPQAATDFLTAVLAENSGKRCFVITHLPNTSGSGILDGAASDSLLSDGTAETLHEILSRHGNAVWLHGHTHLPPAAQTLSPTALYDCEGGVHSVHIPPLCEHRMPNTDGTGETVDPTVGYGYVADVYDQYIVLRGRDFAAGKFVPIAQFCIEVG